jgi:signal transduction histidine kinase/DNA-binding response OmpR family regulator
VDKKGIVWLGNRSGLYELNRRTGESNLYNIENKNRDFLYNTPILSICEDTEDMLWISTQVGLYKFDKIKKYFLLALRATEDWENLYKDRTGILWLGTTINGNGLYKYDPSSKIIHIFAKVANDKNTISNKQITKILDDRWGNFWISTREGLNKYDRLSNKFIHYYLAGPESEKHQNEELIHDILEPQDPSEEMLWIAAELGLYRFDMKTGQFTICRLANGLPFDENVTAGMHRIAEDNNGNIWFSSNNGLGKYNPISKTLQRYSESDGLPGNTFSKAHFKNKDGEMFFGGSNGFLAFFPDSIRDDPDIPNIIITRFQIFNQQVNLDTNVSHIKKITLSHRENVFSFEYAALNFINPKNNQFAHKLEGFDKDWIFTRNKHEVTYTNLDPGEYIFRVKGSNSDGIWNKAGTSVKIIITPPWWKTNWAYAIYVFLFIFMFYALHTYDSKRQRLKHDLELEHLHAEKLEEIDVMKSRFFTNISHEFRTPLTLILGPIQSVRAKISDIGLKNDLNLVLRNATRLKELVNQLMDLSRLEAGKMKLQVEQIDIIPIFRKIVVAFTSLAERKGISLKFKSRTKVLVAYIDTDIIEKIMNNLLTNAFKFTLDGGKVIVDCKLCSENRYTMKMSKISQKSDSPAGVIQNPKSKIVQITVTNSGLAIPADKIDKIFDRFYQVDNSYSKNREGAGIGLSLVKELVELHHGQIDVRCNGSGPSAQTIFTLVLPFGRHRFMDDEIIEKSTSIGKTTSGAISEEVPLMVESADESENERSHISQQKKPLILLIEDNRDMRTYIRDNLQDYYHLIEATDGRQGWDLAIKRIPDLVISDIMMPKMDGYQLCDAIKLDLRTSHIPVILLTARAEIMDKIKGLQTGADDYIPKPFDILEFKVRIQNLINQRQKLRERFSREALFGLNDMSLNQKDEQFLHRVLDIINEHIDDPKFTVQKMCDSLGMSRMTLHLKLKALTGHSPHHFIRLLRLKKAAVLLRQKTASVTEVAYEVGFKSLSHFAKAFREQFGETPSRFSAHQ